MVDKHYLSLCNYHCQDKWANDSVPLNYEYQTRHYMAVMNVDVTYIACLFGNNENEYVIRKIERDYDTEEALINEDAYFWNEYVIKGVEPPYVEGGTLYWKVSESTTGRQTKTSRR